MQQTDQVRLGQLNCQIKLQNEQGEKKTTLKFPELYQSMLELQRFPRPDALPPDPGHVLQYMTNQGSSATLDANFLPYQLQSASSTSSSVYSNWLAGTSDIKGGHLFGLSGKFEIFATYLRSKIKIA